MLDTTINQKTRYIIPAVNPTAMYITEYEGADYAIGFTSEEQLEQYIAENVKQEYDVMLIDVDNPYSVEKFDIEYIDKNYFVAGYDLYSIKRGVQILSLIKAPMELTKIIFSLNMQNEESDYLEYIALGKKVTWDKKNIFFPLGNEDWFVFAENQRNATIDIKRLSNEYKEALAAVLDDILEDFNENQIKKVIKKF